jgi:Family of unknown function (DUF5989)
LAEFGLAEFGLAEFGLKAGIEDQAASPTLTGDIMSSFLSELFAYMGARKKWWLMPVIAMLLVVGGLLVAVQGTALAPFIYTIF